MPYINRALEINPEAADAWVYLAEANIGIDDVDNGLLAYLKSIAIDADQPDTLMAIANIYLEKTEFELAIKFYLAAKGLDDNMEFINLFIAVSYYKVGNMPKAIAYLRVAILENETAAALFLELCPEATNANLLDE